MSTAEISTEPSGNSHYNKAEELFSQLDFNGALEFYLKALKSDPSNSLYLSQTAKAEN